MSQAPTQRVRALFVGINEYRGDIPLMGQGVAFPPLHGCVPDIVTIRDHLSADPTIELIEHTLADQQATKRAIVEAIRDELGQATADESVLIYFSGHGTIEAADPDLWSSETDERLEAIVCYYEDPDSFQFLLTDKELRFLLSWLYRRTQAHITAVFDCCHSGDNLRSLTSQLHPDTPAVTIKRSYEGIVFPARPYEAFLFSQYIEEAAFRSDGVDTIFGPARYLQFAASESNESALEVGGRGVFSQAFLSTLEQSGGLVSNRDLISRVRNQIRFTFDQRPQLYTAPGAEAMLHEGFLGRPLTATALQATLTKQAGGGYLINRGAIHGVREGLTCLDVPVADGSQHRCQLGVVQLDHAAVNVSDETAAQLPDALEISVQLSGLHTNPLGIHLLNKDATPGELEAVIQLFKQPENAPFFCLEDDELVADYTLLLWHDFAYLCDPGERFRPLFSPVSLEESGFSLQLEQMLRHLSQQQFLARLQNDTPEALDPTVLQVDVVAVDAPQQGVPLQIEEDQLTVDLLASNGQEYQRDLQIEITNTGDRDLYVAAVIHSFDGSSRPYYLLEPAVAVLEAGERKWLRDNADKTISVSLDDRCYYYNWPESTDTIQFLLSHAPFDVSVFDRRPLPAPPAPKLERAIRGNFGSDEPATPQLANWNTRQLFVTVRNPHYDQVAPKDIEAMLRDEARPDLAHFALGLYFSKPTRAYGSFGMAKLPASYGTERNLLWDTTLGFVSGWSNFWRNRRYRKMARRYPELPTVVCEGDSWFQHPLLRDIIDAVNQVYPTKSIATAGDTIENYVQQGAFAKTVEDVQPRFFLLSGGGNDVVGEELEGFLRTEFSEAEPGTQPERYFNEQLEVVLNRTIDLYRTIFDRLLEFDSSLHVLVHGYDYSRPDAPGERGGWIGPFFDKVGITNALDRKTAAAYLIDTFNQRLADLVTSYSESVHFIDVRTTVPDGEWDDEIHPDDEGFGKVARLFLQQMAELSSHENNSIDS